MSKIYDLNPKKINNNRLRTRKKNFVKLLAILTLNTNTHNQTYCF